MVVFLSDVQADMKHWMNLKVVMVQNIPYNKE